MINPFSNDPIEDYAALRAEIIGRLSQFKKLKIFFEGELLNEEKKLDQGQITVEKPLIEKD
ncbi:MAG: hypothetical protein HWD61_12785 [Parachlamydiaceae bacterium]|nr:MAG: hypothetical protein HWD61_12785 [Parachlamydiaceae bacterium]